jgi:hypothetical protein
LSDQIKINKSLAATEAARRKDYQAHKETMEKMEDRQREI